VIFLDTNVCIAIMHADERVLKRVRQVHESVAVPAIVAGELYYGVAKSSCVEKNMETTEKFLAALSVYHTSNEIMKLFGMLKAKLELNGTRIDDADVLIAATALVYGAKLATGNVRHFKRFDGLQIENWFEVKHA